MPGQMPATMRFVGLTGPGGPEVLEIRSMPTPVPGAHEVVIKVHAAGINRPDILQRQGKYPPPPLEPRSKARASRTLPAVCLVCTCFTGSTRKLTHQNTRFQGLLEQT
jgi:hypothetical protein